jgi:uncharacterized protein (UPF0276 family)
MAEHASEIMENCHKPLLIENIVSHIVIDGEMSEPEFLNRLCENSGCGLLLDLTALVVNARNHGFDPSGWLRELDLENVMGLHLGGYALRDGHWEDSHDAPIADDVWALAERILATVPVKAAILERDAKFPPAGELREELRRINAIPRPITDDRAANQPRPAAP